VRMQKMQVEEDNAAVTRAAAAAAQKLAEDRAAAAAEAEAARARAERAEQAAMAAERARREKLELKARQEAQQRQQAQQSPPPPQSGGKGKKLCAECPPPSEIARLVELDFPPNGRTDQWTRAQADSVWKLFVFLKAFNQTNGMKTSITWEELKEFTVSARQIIKALQTQPALQKSLGFKVTDLIDEHDPNFAKNHRYVGDLEMAVRTVFVPKGVSTPAGKDITYPQWLGILGLYPYLQNAPTKNELGERVAPIGILMDALMTNVLAEHKINGAIQAMHGASA